MISIAAAIFWPRMVLQYGQAIIETVGQIFVGFFFVCVYVYVATNRGGGHYIGL